MPFSKAIAISTGPATHLDHLGVLAARLEIPLIVTDEKTYHLAKTYYPKAQVQLKELSELSLDYLAAFDVIFQCGKFWTLELAPFIELLFNKKVRFVFCPHGNSDKGHSLTKESAHPPQDIALIYGDHMKDLLIRTGAFENIQKPLYCGNYRLPYYLEHKKFYDDCLKSKVSLDKRKKTLFYAPTWQDKENASSFFLGCKDILVDLSRTFNLIVKLHPFLEEGHPQEILQLQDCFKNHPHVNILFDFPPIYPILSLIDIYLGDFSSIGYDFLAFDKPMFFLNANPNSAGSFLHQCGMQIPFRDDQKISEFIEKNLEQNAQGLSSIRNKIYNYAFGKEEIFAEFKKSILRAL